MDEHVCFLEKGAGGTNAAVRTFLANGTCQDKGLMGCGREVDDAKDEERRLMNDQAKTQRAKESECERVLQSVEDLEYIRRDCYGRAHDFVALCVRVM